MLPVQITIRDMANSLALETLLRKRVEKLSHFYKHIINCKVVVEIPQKHTHKGKVYNVRIEVSVPRKDIVSTHKFNQDVYIAIRESFAAIERQLEEHARKIIERKRAPNNDVLRGHVARIIAKEGYGFIEGIDGNEYYFSITNVAFPHFDQLTIGDVVEYFAYSENDGRQAHHVVKSSQAAF